MRQNDLRRPRVLAMQGETEGMTKPPKPPPEKLCPGCGRHVMLCECLNDGIARWIAREVEKLARETDAKIMGDDDDA